MGRALNAVLGLCRGAIRTGARLRNCARRMYSLWSPSEAERDPPESEQLWCVVHFSMQPTAGLLQISRFQSKLPDCLQAYLSLVSQAPMASLVHFHSAKSVSG